MWEQRFLERLMCHFQTTADRLSAAVRILRAISATTKGFGKLLGWLRNLRLSMTEILLPFFNVTFMFGWAGRDRRVRTGVERSGVTCNQPLMQHTCEIPGEDWWPILSSHHTNYHRKWYFLAFFILCKCILLLPSISEENISLFTPLPLTALVALPVLWFGIRLYVINGRISLTGSIKFSYLTVRIVEACQIHTRSKQGGRLSPE